MYRYTPNKQLLEELKRMKRKDNKQYGSFAWVFVSQFVKDYAERVAFLHDWPQVEFYSKTRVHFVPVRGYLFPLKFFDEVTIANTDAKLS